MCGFCSASHLENEPLTILTKLMHNTTLEVGEDENDAPLQRPIGTNRKHVVR